MAEFKTGIDFNKNTSEDAYNVHVLVPTWDGEIVDKEMTFSPEEAVHFKGHALADHLDIDRIIADGVLEKANPNATYLNYSGFRDASMHDFNEAVKGAVSIHNDLNTATGAGLDGIKLDASGFSVEGVYDANGLRHTLGTVERYLENEINFAKNDVNNDPALTPLIEQGEIAHQKLLDAGANAFKANEMWFQDVKPPGPGIISDDEPVDLSQYEQKADAVDVEAITQPGLK